MKEPTVTVTVEGDEPVTFPTAFSAILALVETLPTFQMHALRLSAIPAMMRRRTEGTNGHAMTGPAAAGAVTK